MFLMHLQVNLPDTFGGIAKYVLRSLMNHDCQEIHFVTDKWVSLSIKYEHDQRGSSSMTYRISGVGWTKTPWQFVASTKEFKY